LPPLAERLAAFRQLSQAIGKNRVNWRFDPLLLTDTLSVDDLLAKVDRIGAELHDHTDKFVFSFADIAGYHRVKTNLESSGVRFREFDNSAMLAFAAGLKRLLDQWKIPACTCAEDVDLLPYGIGHNRCIDGELLLKISGNDPVLFRAFNAASGDGSISSPVALDQNFLKDKGQRKACGCIAAKDIGQYDTCPHLCRYCYANASPSIVRKNLLHLSLNGESIAGKSDQ
jgi:hypothetical protein